MQGNWSHMVDLLRWTSVFFLRVFGCRFGIIRVTRFYMYFFFELLLLILVVLTIYVTCHFVALI